MRLLFYLFACSVSCAVQNNRCNAFETEHVAEACTTGGKRNKLSLQEDLCFADADIKSSTSYFFLLRDPPLPAPELDSVSVVASACGHATGCPTGPGKQFQGAATIILAVSRLIGIRGRLSAGNCSCILSGVLCLTRSPKNHCGMERASNLTARKFHSEISEAEPTAPLSLYSRCWRCSPSGCFPQR